MTRLSAFLLPLMLSASVLAAPTAFKDDFNRPDGMVGNGWLNTTGNVNGDLVISSGTLATPRPSGWAGIYRPIDLSLPMTITGTLTQTNGYGGTLNRYESGFLIGTNGSLTNGYEVVFGRSESISNNSSVIVVEYGAYPAGGTIIAQQYAPFQFGSAIATTVTYSPGDGRILGSVTGDGNTFNFDFGSVITKPISPNIGIVLEFPDNRSPVIINPTMDDISISYSNNTSCASRGTCNTTPTTPLPQPVSIDAQVTPPPDKLVVVTHGWNSSAAAWPEALVNAICAKLPGMSPSAISLAPNRSGITRYCQDSQWGVLAFDWATDAATLLPFTASSNAKQVGETLAKDLWRRTNNGSQSWSTIHLIGHSAGSGFVESFSQEVKRLSQAAGQPAPKIQATFLDAFCPNPLGCSWGSAADLAEQYVDTRNLLSSALALLDPSSAFLNHVTLGLTNVMLPNAINFEITPLDNYGVLDYGRSYPVNFHAFPYRYYIDTAGGTQPVPASFSAYAGTVPFGAKWASWWTGDDWYTTVSHYAQFAKGADCIPSRVSDLGLSYCQSTLARWWHSLTRATSMAAQSSTCNAQLVGPAYAVSLSNCPATGGLTKGRALIPPDPAMMLLKVTLAKTANRIRFNYRFTQATGAGGGLQVFVQDDKMIFVSLQDAGDTTTRNTGWIDIPNLVAGDVDLRIVVKPQGTDHAGAEVSNIEFDYSGTATQTAAFGDTSGNWASLYINGIYGAGVTTGCGNGNYCPASPVTREQMAAFLIRAKEGEPASSYCNGGSLFPDVSAGSAMCKYIKRLAELAVTTGCGSGNYCPGGLVTREQMAAFIVRAKEGEPPANYCGGAAPFNDVSPGSWACGYIKRLSELGVTTGCGSGSYCPSQNVTREQMAAFLARAFLGM